MTTHTMMSFDSHHTIYNNNRTYVRTTYSSMTNQSFHSYLTALPIPSIKIHENHLYGTKMVDDIGSATSSYMHCDENYDNPYVHTYDNPIECLENYNIKQNLINLSHDNENLYDNAQNEIIDDNEKHYSSNTSHSTSPILYYLENKSLALFACTISLLLLFIITFGIFLLNKFLRPAVVNTTVNYHYDTMNISNTSTTPITYRSTVSSALLMLLIQPSTTTIPTSTTTTAIDNLSFPNILCPSDRWGIGCQNICKPCGLGICHPITGKCICPVDIYGEFCDLWKVEDKPKRGDMMS